MASWTCPDCKRVFGAKGRSHMCSPGMTVDEFLDDADTRMRPIFEAVNAHLAAVDAEHGDGELIVDPVTAGIKLKHGATFAMLRPMKKWVQLGFNLQRKLESGRLSRKVQENGAKYWHIINVEDADEIDEELLEWLTEAFDPALASGAPRPSSFDPMVPDDVDIFIEPPQ